MRQSSGCLKPALFGCLGLIGVVVLILLVSLGMAWHGSSQQEMTEHATDAGFAMAAAIPTDPVPGRVVLDVSQVEFIMRPAAPGEAPSTNARYDRHAYELIDSFETLPDGTWVYNLRFQRTIPWLQALLQDIMRRDKMQGPRIEVLLPADSPMALALNLHQGGAEIELGGLWLTEARFEINQGGIDLSVNEPLREPLDYLGLRSRMGGVNASRLGNTSPRFLDIACQMGGADIDLRGAWRGDCHGRFTVRMGGISLSTPADLAVQEVSPGRLDDPTPLELPAAERENSTATLWYESQARMGEVEVRRH
jgi:hypothetical protein